MKLILSCKGEKIRCPNQEVITGLTQVADNRKNKNKGVAKSGAKSKPVKQLKLLKFLREGVATYSFKFEIK